MADNKLSFEGRVAIVTGAGNGLGRQYALDLARRCCRVVVNDLGGSTRGEGSGHRAADAVVQLIQQHGGQAVANYDSVTDGAKIVKTAIDTWGRVDIVVNNAGILRDVSFAKMTDNDWKLLHAVHLDGAYAVTKAAWPYMRQQKYGRIIMVTSAAGLYGNFGQAHYSSVKMALVGLANTLAKEGAKQNILVNTIAPIAGSRMTETVLPPDLIAALKPEYVSPLVQYLVHESNKQTGGIYEVGAGWVSRVRLERSRGVFFDLPAFRIEDVAARMKDIEDFTSGTTYPSTPQDAFASIMQNVERCKNMKAGGNSPAAGSGGKNSNIDVQQALSFKMEPLSHTYTECDVMLYALGIGAAADPMDKSELRFVYENHPEFQAFPTLGVVIPSAALNQVMSIPGLKFNPMALLHGEQQMELKKPLPTSATLKSYPRIKNIYDKGSGALVELEVSTRDDKGAELINNVFSLFVRGLGKFGGDKGPAPPKFAPPPHTPPEVVHREKTLDNQALLYRLSGDYNPLHADPDMAKMGGFNQPILHGLCSFGYAARAVVRHYANNDGRRFKAIRARFASPVFPGETLVTEMWRVSPTRIVFRCRVAERGVYAINNAMVELHPDPNAPKAAAAPAVSTPIATAASPAGGTGFKAEAVFTELSKQASPDLVAKVKGSFRFDITKGNEKRYWLLDLKQGSGSINLVDDKAKADCTIAISDDDFVKLMKGTLNPQQAFMKGQIKLRGNLMLAQKLQLLQPPKSKL